MYDKGTTVALIYGVGEVMRGKSGYDPVFQEVTMGADTVAAAFRAAVDDKKVKDMMKKYVGYSKVTTELSPVTFAR